MFSGIVDHCGTVRRIDRRPTSMTLSIDTVFTDLAKGESIAVDGVCLTVTENTPGGFQCDLSSETLGLTVSETYDVGSRVNLERSLRLGDRIGGHFVTGHVDRKGVVISRSDEADFSRFVIGGFDEKEMHFMFRKGSVALNGVSLTVNDVNRAAIEIMLIPHTMERTNLGALAAGTLVNVEFDWMTKVIVNEVQSMRHLT